MPTPASENAPLLARPRDADQTSLYSSSYASSVSETGDRRWRKTKQTVRLISFITANLCALGGGSIVVFSLWAPLFQSHLHYTQFQVNAVAIAGSIALYLPISILGYICDRVGIRPLALLAAVFFGIGYALAAGVYRKLDLQDGGILDDDGAWSVPLMMIAFVCIGGATCSIYMAAVSSCAKNFGKGKYRGLALASPITSFGLSPMWLSQVGNSRLFTERRPDGSPGDLDVFRFFVFLGVLNCSLGVLATLTMTIVNEQDLIDEAIDELEQSGLLDGSTLLARSVSYGTADPSAREDPASLEQSKDDDARWKKNWVLNTETRQFLTDRTMWSFALAFLFMVGPGEAFINNLGTVIGTLSPPTSEGLGHRTSAATHVSIFGVTSTLSRILIGTITDLVAPSPQTQHVQVTSYLPATGRRFVVSRVAFLLFFGLMLSLGLVTLASGFVQDHAERFWIVSGLIGAGYGAIFSLTPLIVTIIWGVENFSTNFGIIAMLPALGSTFWGLVYSAVYQAGANQSAHGETRDLFCHGKQCYESTFWAEGVTVWVGCGLLLWAWKGNGGWKQRGIVI
ncbi:putative transporter MCH1 [Neonectria ditissima]|uniref:Probable transporter MCH1 n=1 Tax=Neonectria ditissima TaxID=78410 RepID=A0A0P7BCV9_9HYPO|nr:putative transporter MCH1 [Neonectria ditissima]